jgi:hypothetical protein
MDGVLAAALRQWSMQTWYRQPEDWVFANQKMHGKQPYWPEGVEVLRAARGKTPGDREANRLALLPQDV